MNRGIRSPVLRKDYDGDETGSTLDRSAIQWIRLEIDGNGQLVAVNNQSHGRIYDACEVAPFWYHFPSLRAFSEKALRAAVLLPGSRVGSTVTAC